MVERLIEKLFKTSSLGYDEIIYILDNLDARNRELLFRYANIRRIENYGKKVYLRGLIEFSNYCKNNCMYCGIRRDNIKAERYRLTPEEILECCTTGYGLGYRTFVLQSGEDPFYTDDLLSHIISSIKEHFPDCAVTLSIGERSYDSYKRLFDAGADRFLLRHETASKKLYQKLHPGMSFENRRRCLEDLKKIGYQVGAGFIVGLPGQTNEVLAMDLLFLKELEPHMVGIGPFIVHPDTPLKDFPDGTADKTFICLALIRLLLPGVLLPATTALRVADARGMEKGLEAGANVIMPNLTPARVRGKYELYKGKPNVKDDAGKYLAHIKRGVEDAGYEIDMGRGDHKDWERPGKTLI